MASDAGDNLFDSILMADNRFHNEGYQEGFEEGVRVGLAEGRSHGAAHGAKVATEARMRLQVPINNFGFQRSKAEHLLVILDWKVSFYYGFALTWKCLLQNSTDARASKRLKTVESLIGLIQRFPHDDPSYENLQEDIERVRAKFRQTCSLLNVPVDFRDYVNGSHGLSF